MWVVLALMVLAYPWASAQDAVSVEELPVSTCAAIRGLSREEAMKQLPVRIIGTMTYEQVDALSEQKASFSIIVQDETEGIYITANPYPSEGQPRYESGFKPEIGMRVEIIGVTAPGGYAPVIGAIQIRELGESPLPPARKVTLTELRTGCYDCRRVELTGVVQRTYRDDKLGQGRMRMEIAAPDGVFSVFVSNSENLNSQKLVDAEVQVRGSCFMLFNSRGEGLGAYLQAADGKDVVIQEAAPADPFKVPLVPSYSLRPYGQEPPNPHRQRVQGTVTLWRPGQFMYLKGEHRAFRINTHEEAPLAVGDFVEAVGFVGLADSFAVMNEAIYRKIGRNEVPEPLPITRSQVMAVSPQSSWSLADEDYDGRLVSLKGRLVRVQPGVTDFHRLYLDCEGALTVATLGQEVPARVLQDLPLGSELRVVGICSVRLNARWPAMALPEPSGLSLQMRGPADIEVLSSPSWWSERRLLWGLSITAAVIVALILWNLTLRNTVASQTSLIAERVAKETKLEERQRIGRELHDTLQQELTGIGMLIGNSKANLHRPEKAQESLIMAERMVQRASEESRSSIQDLMSVTLENRGLKATLQELVRPMAELKGARFHVHFPASLPRLSTRMETTLLRIAHEAAANAGKHALATEVHLMVETTADVIRMIIQDNGIGFDVASTRSTGQRNFGLLTMDERALKLKGQLTVVSALDVGTTVTVTLPLPKHV